MELSIIFEDEHFVAINKPTALLVHRTKISEDTIFALQMLRNQIKKRVYPIHRLDRPTSGVLIFGKSSEDASSLGELFTHKKIRKTYFAIVRGFVKEKAIINYPLKTERAKISKEAITKYKKLTQNELPFAIGNRYKTARFSYVKIEPLTGRTHQIRRHFAHIRHPIIGDVRYGDVKQNKYFKNEFGISRMLLHAFSLEFEHPFKNEVIKINADFDDEFLSSKELLKL